MDKTEYHRNYYYKRDKTKLDKYRKDYLRRKADREWHKRYYQTHKKYYQIRYQLNRDMIVAEYRNKKLKEFVDSVENKEPKMIGDKIKYIKVE